jgi:hypothetical protein
VWEVVRPERQVQVPGGGTVTIPELRVPIRPDQTLLAEQAPLFEEPLTPDDPDERADAEPMIIDGTDVYVFYRKIQPDGARFWRAKVYT